MHTNTPNPDAALVEAIKKFSDRAVHDASQGAPRDVSELDAREKAKSQLIQEFVAKIKELQSPHALTADVPDAKK